MRWGARRRCDVWPPSKVVKNGILLAEPMKEGRYQQLSAMIKEYDSLEIQLRLERRYARKYAEGVEYKKAAM